MSLIIVDEVKSKLDFDELVEVLKTFSWNTINKAPWFTEFPYIPEVQFQVAHSKEELILHYVVQEEFVKAQYIRINENVWEDSCVEFFLSLDNKQTYYNLEFNVLGTGLIGYGPAVKSERNRLEASVTDQVDTFTKVVKKDGIKTWEIYIVIPKIIFGNVDYAGKTFHANFYKCGDGLPQPHFSAWNAIDNPTPNFHLPQFFGELKFK